MIDLYLGIIGMVCILTAFILNEFVKSYNANTLVFNLINLVGSGLLIYYAYTLQSIPFLILNGVWFATAVFKISTLKK